jgi:hypothetical protein
VLELTDSNFDSERAARIAAVLDGLQFPAPSWQIITQGDSYGADICTRAELVTLPERSYPDIEAVIEAVAASSHSRVWSIRPRRRRLGGLRMAS